MAADRAGAPPRAWQRMLSGRRLDLLDPSPLDIEISDIAHGLARVARWNGQTSGDHAFSVAQHSLLVEAVFGDLMPEASADARLAALLHDAPEYVIGDMISPFKSVMGGGYKDCRTQASARHPSALFAAGRTGRRPAQGDQARRPALRLFRGDAACRLLDRRSDGVLRPAARLQRRPLRFHAALGNLGTDCVSQAVCSDREIATSASSNRWLKGRELTRSCDEAAGVRLSGNRPDWLRQTLGHEAGDGFHLGRARAC